MSLFYHHLLSPTDPVLAPDEYMALPIGLLPLTYAESGPAAETVTTTSLEIAPSTTHSGYVEFSLDVTEQPRWAFQVNQSLMSEYHDVSVVASSVTPDDMKFGGGNRVTLFAVFGNKLTTYRIDRDLISPYLGRARLYGSSGNLLGTTGNINFATRPKFVLRLKGNGVLNLNMGLASNFTGTVPFTVVDYS